MTAGRPMSASAARASSRVWAMADFGRFDADFGHGVAEFQAVLGAVDHLGAWRRSVRRRGVPARRLSASCIAVLSAVWPPMVGSSASGFSRAMIFSTISGVIGSI